MSLSKPALTIEQEIQDKLNWNGHYPLIQSPRLDGIIPLLGLHRFLTYPTDYEARTGVKRENLANSGICISRCKTKLFCVFCSLVITSLEGWTRLNAEEIDKKHQESTQCPLFTKETGNVPLDPSECINFAFESCRLYSLAVIQWRSPVDIFELATAGFYFVGDEDNVRCVFCKLEVRGWEPGDTAEGEHKRWNPKCPFVQGKLVGNVTIGQELNAPASDSSQGTLSTNPFYKQFDISKFSNPTLLNILSQKPFLTPEKLGIKTVAAAKYPNYAMLCVRLNSFKKDWPASMGQKPDVLANAGFFYTGTGDRVFCFHCGVGLKDWSPQDHPWTEHIKWNSTCQYVRMMKNKEAIQQVVQSPQSCSTSMSIESEIKNEEKELKKITNNLCILCEENEIDTVNLPCGHMLKCSNCNKTNSNCEECKIQVVASLRVYMN